MEWAARSRTLPVAGRARGRWRASAPHAGDRHTCANGMLDQALIREICRVVDISRETRFLRGKEEGVTAGRKYWR